jgi:hypothetical protein
MPLRTPSINVNATTITITTTTILAAISTYIATKSISKYGIQGTLRYIWEGDHLSPHIRHEMDTLASIQSKMIQQKKKLNRVSVTIETAKLNSVDEIIEEGEKDEKDLEGSSSSSPNDSNGVGGGTLHPTSEDETGASTSTSVSKGEQPSTHMIRHYILSQVPSLSKDLGMLSYKLDQLAAEVDAVQSHGDEDVKRQKKELSQKLVEMMGSCDGFMVECGVES